MRILLGLSYGVLIAAAGQAQPAKPFVYPPGKCGKGELKYIGKVPVLILEGTAAQMGEQIGRLAAKPAAQHPKPTLYDYPRDFFRHELTAEVRRQFPKWPVGAVRAAVALQEPGMWAKFQKIAGDLEPHFPADQRAELEALIRAGGLDQKQVISANGMFDLGHASEQLKAGCSSVIIPARHSATGGLLFGRNLDYAHFGYLHQYSLLMVYRPTDKTPDGRPKHRFASAGFPGLVGSFTGMNDAGLTIASHDVLEPNTTTKFNPKGVPFAMAYRRILEECATVGDALKLLDSIERASITSLVIADPTGGAVIEVTPDSLAIRRIKERPGVCTNHFCVTANQNQREKYEKEQLDAFRTFGRFDDLSKLVAVKKGHKFGIGDIKSQLGAANLRDDDDQTEMTIQTFVFEPETRTVHLNFGDGIKPSTEGKLTKIELKELWGK